MKGRRRNRLAATPANGRASHLSSRVAGAGSPSVSSQVRNAYCARWLAGQALQDLEARRSHQATEALATWSAEVAGKGGIDLAAAVRAASSWRSRDDQAAVQRDALAGLSKLLEEQIGRFKKSDPAAVIAVLKERIAALQAGQDRSEREGSARRSELQRLLEELSSIDPDQPSHGREGRRAGPKQT